VQPAAPPTCSPIHVITSGLQVSFEWLRLNCAEIESSKPLPSESAASHATTPSLHVSPNQAPEKMLRKALMGALPTAEITLMSRWGFPMTFARLVVSTWLFGRRSAAKRPAKACSNGFPQVGSTAAGLK